MKATDRGRLSAGEIQAQLLHTMVDAAAAPNAPRVGLLTAMNRDDWAKARDELMKGKQFSSDKSTYNIINNSNSTLFR